MLPQRHQRRSLIGFAIGSAIICAWMIIQVDVVGFAGLHTAFWDSPQCILEVELISWCVDDFAFAQQGEPDQPQAQFDGRVRSDVLQLLEHDADLRRR